MATESTAIVNLIDLMRKRPLPKEADDHLLFGGNARFDATAMPVQAAPVMLPPPSSPGPHYDHVRLPLDARRIDDRRNVGPSSRSRLVKKLALPVGAGTVAVFLLTMYLAKRDSAPAAASASEPTLAPVALVTPPPVAEPETPAAVVTPSEAKVETTVTPIETAAAPADPDNKFAHDPALAPTVPTGPAVVPPESPVVAAAERAATAKAKKGSRTKSSRAAKRTKAQKRETKVAMIEPVKKVQLGGKGQLAISSVSGGQIWVDGRATKTSRMTLEPGKHNVTMFDKKTKKAKTFQVEIKPNQTTTVRR